MVLFILHALKICLENLKSFGNLDLLIPGMENLEICENPVKVMDFEAMVMEILFFTISKIKKCLFGIYLVFLGPTYFPQDAAGIDRYVHLHNVHSGSRSPVCMSQLGKQCES
jgi:hypothetical protein